MKEEWLLPGTVKDKKSITSDWEFSGQTLIDGVSLKEVRNVPKGNGSLTELYRRDWGFDDRPLEHVFAVTLTPRGISAWHAHAVTSDRLFVIAGLVRIVLYDARRNSPTYGMLNQFKLGTIRPGLLLVPPKVWHGIQNVGEGSAMLINMTDIAYQYDDPDHWRVPSDSNEIPFQFPENG